MKKYKKTYAIYHLAEKHTVFFLGKTRVHVSFTGGMVSKKGVTPATFTTVDPIVQLAIENSADFRNGVITLKSKYPLGGEVKIGKNEPEPATQQSTIETKLNSLTSPDPAAIPVPLLMTEQVSAPIQKENAAHEEEEEEDPVDEDEETEEHSALEGEKDEKDLEVVEVSCKDVAKQYLQDHYGEKPAPLRTRNDVQECAAKHGIIFKFI